MIAIINIRLNQPKHYIFLTVETFKYFCSVYVDLYRPLKYEPGAFAAL